MSRDQPSISIIIPTHNRSASLRRTLDALCFQTYPVQCLEVLVVADGCTDGTIEMLKKYKAPFALHVIGQPARGAATARNRGASVANAPYLLFLDDDVEPTPILTEAHVHVHQQQPGRVVLGPYPPVFERPLDFYRTMLRTWWNDLFRAMRRPGHRYSYKDLVSGNLSIEARLFARMGGFDPAFRSCGGEDYEFGVRLIKANVPFAFAADALAYHHETSDLDRSFRRRRQEGYADVLIGARHPELRPTLSLARPAPARSHLNRTLRILAFRCPRAGDALATCIRPALDVLEQARMRDHWRHLYNQLRDYWYWRGVAGELGSQQALSAFLQGDPSRPDEGGREIEIDLCAGLSEAEHRLDEERPDGMCICYGTQPVGRIPTQAGAEKLRGVHLRTILATQLAWPLLLALTMDGAIGSANESSRFPVVPDPKGLEITHTAQETPKETPVPYTTPEKDGSWP